jgi:hypothetical protein
MEEPDSDAVGHGRLEHWPNSDQTVVDGHLRDLFFNWTVGPTNSVAGLRILDLGEGGHLTDWNELEPLRSSSEERSGISESAQLTHLGHCQPSGRPYRCSRTEAGVFIGEVEIVREKKAPKAGHPTDG